MLCPSCGATELIPDTRDIPYTYKGVSATIPAVSGKYCPTCGEGVLNREHGDRYGKLIGQFQHKNNLRNLGEELKIEDTTQELDYLFINGIKATIASADPIWSAQMLEMQLGKRSPGNFEPPIPLDLINNMLTRSKKQ